MCIIFYVIARRLCDVAISLEFRKPRLFLCLVETLFVGFVETHHWRVSTRFFTNLILYIYTPVIINLIKLPMATILNKFLVNNQNQLSSAEFDLQSHTIFSDGKYSPEALINSTAGKSLKIISITDHNSLSALTKENFDLAKQNNVVLLPGVEVECGGGLDVLVYDDNKNDIDQSYRKSITELVNGLNQERSVYVVDSISKIIEFLQNSDGIEWMNWKSKTEDEKNKIIKYLTLENACRVDLKTGKQLEIRRDYVSKPHLGMLLAPFNLINLKAFAIKFNILIEQAPKYALGYIFAKVIPWPLDTLPINKEIVSKVVGLPFVKIMAHPGKTFENLYREDDITIKKFTTFLMGYLSKGLDGAEGDYRRYKNPKLDYNTLTKQILLDFQKQTDRSIYSTGGSDTHDIFE